MATEGFFYKTFIAKSLFGRDSFVVGPDQVHKKLDETTDNSTIFDLLNSTQGKIGSLVKLNKPIPLYIIVLTDAEYYEVNLNKVTVSIFNICKDVVVSNDEEYLELINTYLYAETSLIPQKVIVNKEKPCVTLVK